MSNWPAHLESRIDKILTEIGDEYMDIYSYFCNLESMDEAQTWVLNDMLENLPVFADMWLNGDFDFHQRAIEIGDEHSKIVPIGQASWVSPEDSAKFQNNFAELQSKKRQSQLLIKLSKR
ncbi:hypothetical protein D3C72_1122010 [compost metagenome]